MEELTLKHIDILKNTQDLGTWLRSIETISKLTIKKLSTLNAYHQFLIFQFAYPKSATTFRMVKKELARIDEIVKNSNKLKLLSNTGLSYTSICCSFSAPLAQWLTSRFNKAVWLEGSTAGPETIQNILQSLLPGIEYENSTQGNLSITDRIKKITGLKERHEQLKWILQLFEQNKNSTLVNDELYRQLALYIQWDITTLPITIDALGELNKVYYHQQFITKLNSHSIIKEKIKKAARIPMKQKSDLLDFMKLSLAKMCRETDPITYGDTNQLELFEMGRGLKIALIGMQLNRRLALESYIGFMAFKNGIPVSYGGAWIWGHRCKIGINIFPAFRKGESAWLFSQILRLYHQQYTIHHFIVKPYQFGKGNLEGLQSGAFWFYYKLGFRPASALINQLTEKEMLKIKNDNSYRSSIKTLYSFTSSNLELKLTDIVLPNFDAGIVSKIISDYINVNFQGDRAMAVQAGKRLIKKIIPVSLWKNRFISNESILDNWALLYAFLTSTNSLTNKEEISFVRLIQNKVKLSEYAYIKYLQKQSWLWRKLALKN